MIKKQLKQTAVEDLATQKKLFQQNLSGKISIN